MVTSRDVARVAGVSQATVSRVLQNSIHVKDSTRQRVLSALKEVGYSPNANARAMRTRRTGAIGIVMERVTNPFYPELLETLSRELTAANMRMMLWLSEGEAELSAVEAIHENRADGVIFTTVRKGSTALREAIETRAPFVLVNRVVEGLTCDQVSSDNFEGARMVGRYFLRQGHKDLAVICGLRGVSTNDDRLRGFLAAVQEAGGRLKSHYVVDGDFTHQHGVEAFHRLMALKKPPTAIFCVNDLIALGVLDAARSLGMRIPEDVWVVGYDDIDMASWPSHDLSTVKQRLDDMARAAVELLLQRIATPEREPTCLRFPSQFIIRGSTNHLPYEQGVFERH